ncbi:MAG: MFS transporter, partial [Actinomycetota bacterium]|nr:MFS transporter [Actinomycetota bacterium]
RATGAFRSSFLVGIGAGPVFGGVIADRFGLAAPFHFYATGLIVAAAIAWVVMAGEQGIGEGERKTPVQALREAAPLMRDYRYVIALLATLVGWWTISGPAQVVGPIFAEDVLGLSEGQIGLAVTMLSVGEILILFAAGKAADAFGRRAVLVPSLAVTAVATALLGRIETTPLAYYPLMVALGASIAAGGTAAGGLLADSIPRSGSGAAVGVNQMAGDLGYLTSPTAIGAVADAASYRTAYLVGALPAAAAFLAALKLPKGKVSGDQHPPAEPHPVG